MNKAQLEDSRDQRIVIALTLAIITVVLFIVILSASHQYQDKMEENHLVPKNQSIYFPEGSNEVIFTLETDDEMQKYAAQQIAYFLEKVERQQSFPRDQSYYMGGVE